MSKIEKKFSLHHQLCESRGWLTNTTNCEMIRDTTHRAIHCLFQNQTFAEKLITMTNLDAKALRPDVVQWLIEALEARWVDDIWARYKKDCFQQ